MEKYEIFESDFYQNYSKSKLRLYRKRLDMLERLIDNEDLEGALNCVIEEPYNTVPEFAFYRINILIRLKRFEEALLVASDSLFINFRPVQTQKKGLTYYFELLKEYESKTEETKEKDEVLEPIETKKKRKYHNVSKQDDNNGFKESVLTAEVRLLTKIYVGIINPSEIEEANLDEFKKIILKACYYDKFNRSAGAKYLKKVRNTFNGEERKILNKLMALLENKKILNFNINIYKDLLKAGICESYAEALLKEEKMNLETKNNESNGIEVVSNSNVDTKVQENVKKSTTKPKYITSGPIKREEVISTLNKDSKISTETSSEVDTSNLTNKNTSKHDNRTIEEVFPNETDAIRKALYCLMNAKKQAVYVSQFDNFDILVKKSVNNIKALEKFESVVLKCSNYTNINVDYNEEKFKSLKMTIN